MSDSTAGEDVVVRKPASSSLLLAPQPPSPFPSPSSSFVPPPAQEPHEFANKTTARMAAAKTHSRRNSEDTKPQTTSPHPQPSPKLPEPSNLSLSIQPQTPKRFSADSNQSGLSSSRPAPASPALSRHSSLLHTGSRKRLSTLSIVSTPPQPAAKPLPVVKIRDFAFPVGDERHVGDGPLSKRLSSASSSSSGWPPDDEYESQDEDDEPLSQDDSDAFVPGIYRALYAFEPEGTAEMALVEDQQVRVLGRGGGVGWVVVLKPGGGSEQALVPEGYLEFVSAEVDDDDEHDDEESVGGATEAPRTPRAVS
ncbi:hypothetical protein RhiJN_00239 [Ceratobasidium sp. AG-Ba]|nr:hypothetical protein RhiJN_00239 [Ceratobasidium sp. AG-Ba]QRW01273.1 hypothetical protein RhiLY_00270 [Ceratobasidium sp. AG-Ba]